MSFDHNITEGYIQRHKQDPNGIDVRIAILDIAQDFLITHLFKNSMLEEIVALKGGTALRKFFAGQEGRFSTDLDFSLRDTGESQDEIATLIGEELNSEFGPFNISAKNIQVDNDDRPLLNVSSNFQTPDPHIAIKIDVGPWPWLKVENQNLKSLPIHKRYNYDLPQIPCMRLEEIISEKIARLNRSSTARDAWDLVWIATTSPFSDFDRELVKELIVLKIWVDNHGLGKLGDTSLNPKAFDPDRWFSSRGSRWDDEQIGELAVESPSLEELEKKLFQHYKWISNLNETQQKIASADQRDERKVVEKIRDVSDKDIPERFFYNS